MTDAGEVRHGKLKRKTEAAGVGCLIQAIGLVLVWFFPIGTVLGLILLVYGSMKATFWVCGLCGTKLAGNDVTVCPACHASLSR